MEFGGHNGAQAHACACLLTFSGCLRPYLHQFAGMHLFPFVGRHRGGVYELEDGRKGLKAPLHGFLSEMVMDPGPADDSGCAFVWSSGSKGCNVPEHADWPFEAIVTIRCTIHEHKLTVHYHVRIPISHEASATTLAVPVPLSLGNHISLVVDWSRIPPGSTAAETTSTGDSSIHIVAASCAASSCAVPITELPLVPGGQVETAVPLPPALGGAVEEVAAPAAYDSDSASTHAWAAPASVSLSGLPLDDDSFFNAVVAFDANPFQASTCSATIPEDTGASEAIIPQDMARVAVGEVIITGVGLKAGCTARVANGRPRIVSASSRGVSTLAQAARAAAIARGCTFVFWGTPGLAGGDGRGFICPEPWMGVPDSMNSGIGAAKLVPGEELEWWWSMEVAQTPRHSTMANS